MGEARALEAFGPRNRVRPLRAGRSVRYLHGGHRLHRRLGAEPALPSRGSDSFWPPERYLQRVGLQEICRKTADLGCFRAVFFVIFLEPNPQRRNIDQSQNLVLFVQMWARLWMGLSSSILPTGTVHTTSALGSLATGSLLDRFGRPKPSKSLLQARLRRERSTGFKLPRRSQVCF